MDDWRPNPFLLANEAIPTSLRCVITPGAVESAYRDVSRLPGYFPTPTYDLRAMAERFGVRSLWYKDESRRFGLASFKALGAGYAVLNALRAFAREKGHAEIISVSELDSPSQRLLASGLTIACASDGNHGRAVAWACALFGCPCVIYLHEGVSLHREKAISAFGARVERRGRSYDEAVEAARNDSCRCAWRVVSDTAYPGCMDIPQRIMQGYAILGLEIERERLGRPTHQFIQAGVGGLAAAVCAYYWHLYGLARPKVVVAEPESAACFFAGAGSIECTGISGTFNTIMTGLACGQPSLIAKNILTAGAAGFVTVSDAAVPPLIRALANPALNDPPIAAGASAVAGLAALEVVRNRREVAHSLGLDRDSRVLVIGSEGITDPDAHQRILAEAR